MVGEVCLEDGHIREENTRERRRPSEFRTLNVADRVENELHGTGFNTHKVVALGEHAINPLIEVITEYGELPVIRAAIACLEEFGKIAVPKLIKALELSAKRENGHECFQISMVLGQILHKVDAPEAMQVMIQVSAHPNRIISESVYKNIGDVSRVRALHFRKIILDRDARYAVEAGLGAVDMAIGDLTHLCGGKLDHNVKKGLDTFRAMVAATSEKQNPRMKLCGAADGETVRLKRRPRPRAEMARAMNLGRAISAGR